MNSPQEVLECLKAGNFEDLRGLVENGWFEAKQSPYLFNGDKQRLELAKDVSALANARGGILVIGFVTGKEPTVLGYRVEKVSPFPLSMARSDQIRKLLAEWVHPSLKTVEVHTFVCRDDPNKGVAAILVDDAVTAPGRPYLVSKMLDESEGVIGAQFGYFERIRDRVPTTSVARLQQLISAGQSFSAIQERLMSMESAMASLKAPVAQSPGNGGVKPEIISRRLWAARVAAEKNDAPVIYFTAAAQDACDFPRLFESGGERVVRLI